MYVRGIDGLTPATLDEAIRSGGRFVFFECCISCLIYTLRRPSEIVFLPYDHWGWLHGLPYTILSLFFGWWALPWGVIYTPLVLATNLSGGCNVTGSTRAYLAQFPHWQGLARDN
jgi:hypothetical protein